MLGPPVSTGSGAENTTGKEPAGDADLLGVLPEFPSPSPASLAEPPPSSGAPHQLASTSQFRDVKKAQESEEQQVRMPPG